MGVERWAPGGEGGRTELDDPGAGGEGADDVVDRRLVLHALHQHLRFGAAAVLSFVGLTALVWPAVDRTRVVVWCAVAVTLGVLVITASLAGVRGWLPLRRAELLTGGALLLQGLLTGLLPLLVPISDRNSWLSLAYEMWVVASALSWLITSSASRRIFVVTEVALLVSNAVALAADRAGSRQVLLLLDALLLGTVFAQRGVVVSVLRGALSEERRATALAAALGRERDRTSAANQELEQVNLSLAHAAGHDQLTGLANRSHFQARLVECVTRYAGTDRVLAVLFCDLDRFKQVNDSLGHAAGDELLLVVGQRIQRALRAGDLAARHGGDEFTLLLTDLSTPQEAVGVAERLRAELTTPFLVGGVPAQIGVSVGIALLRGGGDAAEAEELLRSADSALYLAKERGGNLTEVFDDTLRASLQERVAREAELRHALASGQIVPWFQPVVDLATGRIVGAECLARWQHPERGVLLPGEFLPLVVESGLDVELGKAMTAVALDVRRRITPLVAPSFRVALNIAARRATLAQVVAALQVDCARHGTPPTGVTLEILETTVIGDPVAARVALRRARAMGFAVALDDFGTGFSSLSLVRDLPLDVIKIDRSFVSGMSRSDADEAVVLSVLDLAHRLRLKVVAEGVETRDDVERLLAAGAVLGQGFHYSRAVPGEELERWLATGAPWQPAAARL